MWFCFRGVVFRARVGRLEWHLPDELVIYVIPLYVSTPPLRIRPLSLKLRWVEISRRRIKKKLTEKPHGKNNNNRIFR